MSFHFSRADKSKQFGDAGFDDCSKNSKRYILIIEDDLVVKEIIAEALSKFFSSEVLSASSAEAALELCKKHAGAMDCVIMDYGMPDMHATRLIKELRSIDLKSKVILASGYPESLILSDFPGELVDSFIAKPFSPLKLIGLIEALLLVQREVVGPAITYQI